MAMMTKTFENVQQLGKEWGNYSRRMSRDALRAMSGQLENAARYLGSLSSRLEADEGDAAGQNGHAPEGGQHASQPDSQTHDSPN